MNVLQLEPKGMWSLHWLENLFSGPEFKHVTEVTGEGAFVLVPAEYWAERVDELNALIDQLTWSVVILASDERGLFPIEELSKDVDSLWVMTPHFESHYYPEGTNFIGEFFPADARALLASAIRTRADQRKYTVGFSGQITHERREELASAMTDYSDHYYLNQTAGFTQGLGRQDYYQLMVDCQTVPAPSGPVTLDSFRAFEALEAGAVPVLDLVCPIEQDGHLYWNSILGADHPLPTLSDWNDLHECGREIDDRWPAISNQVSSWWQLYKRSITHRLKASSPIYVPDNHITILMPTSPIPSNPSLDKISFTIESVRHHLPTADILVLCDGVRPEQEDRRSNYETFVSDLLWKANFEWTNVYPIYDGEFRHQAGMTQLGLEYVNTDLIMYVEHDIPLITDYPIDFAGIERLIESDDLNVVRFAFENQIHPDWEHLMLDPAPVTLHGVPIRRTRQWSQRVHVTRTSFYRDMMRDYFTESDRTMIEDRIYGVAKADPAKFKMAFYHPSDYIGRCYHTDGREEDPKFDMWWDES